MRIVLYVQIRYVYSRIILWVTLNQNRENNDDERFSIKVW